jgi:hypothetical protein
MLVIDDKYNNDDGLGTGRMCQVGTRSILERTTTMIACLQLLMARTTTTKVRLQERIVATLAGL